MSSSSSEEKVSKPKDTKEKVVEKDTKEKVKEKEEKEKESHSSGEEKSNEKEVKKESKSEDDSSKEEVVVKKKEKKKESKSEESSSKSEKEAKKEQPEKKKEEEKPSSPRDTTTTTTKTPSTSTSTSTTTATTTQSSDAKGGHLYFKVLEVKGVSKKPKNYYVSVRFDTNIVHKSSVTKKSMKWEDQGVLLNLNDSYDSMLLRLYEKGLIDTKILDVFIGQHSFKVTDFKDEYPYEQWYPLHEKKPKKEKKPKGEVLLQILYFPPGAKHTGREFHYPLHFLLNKNKLELFERKLDELKDINQKDNEENTILIASTIANKPDFLKIVLKKGGKEKINEHKTSKGLTVLHVACDKNPGLVDLLIEAGSKVDEPDGTEAKNLPIHYAAQSNHVSAIDSLVKAKADVNQPNSNGDPAMNFALQSKSLDAIKSLIKYKCDVYKKNNKNITVWEMSQKKEVVDKEARVTFMKELDVIDPREFKLIKKFGWKTRVFGKPLSIDWRKSEQYTFTVKEKTKVAILLFYVDADIKKIDFATKVGFCVVKGGEGIHKEPTFWPGGIGFGGLKPFKGEFEPGNNYTIVPYAKSEEVEGDFSIIIYTDGKPVESKKLQDWGFNCGVDGEWLGKTAGGSQGSDPQSSQSWKNNKTYELALPKKEKCRFCVFLSQEKDATPRLMGASDYKIVPYPIYIGFYVYDRTVSKLLDQTDKWLNSRDVYKHFTLDTTHSKK